MNHILTYKIHASRFSYLSQQKDKVRLVFLFFILLFINLSGKAQSSKKELKAGDYDEIVITLNVPRIGSVEIPAVIYEETAYLPVKELFDYLKIKNNVTPNFYSVEGFFIDPGASYLISKTGNQISYEGKVYALQPSDMIITETGLYLKSSYFGQVFKIDCQFNFRSLSVNLITNVELPALREMKLEAMRKNLNQLRGEKKADTTIKRSFSIFRAGMLDWSVLSTKESTTPRNTRVTLGLGLIIAGGETDLFLNYYYNQPFKLRDQFYFWRYINNENPLVRQVTVGKILANPASTLTDGIVGIQVNNTPTTFRRSFGTYTISEKTEPGWTVELYVNNVLVNFTKADPSGFFTFEVPMVYGSSVVRLRYYGPWGEERTREQNLTIPFNFLPRHQFEYNINAGVVEDSLKSKFTRAQFSYGLNSRITIGGGMEYLSSVFPKALPFINVSARLGSKLFISAEHIQNVKTHALLNYKLPYNIAVELNYLRFNKDQRAIRINFLEERRLTLTKSFFGKKYSAFSRVTINQFNLSTYAKQPKFTSAELLLSGMAYGISANLTNYIITSLKHIPLAYSNLSMTFRFPHGINFLPQARFEYTINKFSLLRAEVEKSLFNRGFLNLSYERDKRNNTYIAGVGFRYNLSFAETSFSTRFNKQSSITNEQIRGSILYDNKSNFIGLNKENQIGRGGLIVIPYLDLNCNGKRDSGEPGAPGLKLKINGGRIMKSQKDTTIRISALEAFTNYFVELDKTSFDNISWQIRKPVIQINIDPNHFTYLEVPVSVVGEANGNVYIKGNNGNSGLGRIVVNIYKENSQLVARTVSEGDGYFSYLGLPPGNYTAKIDPDQLNKLNMLSTPMSVPILIRKSREGDVVGGINFTLLISKKNDK